MLILIILILFLLFLVNKKEYFINNNINNNNNNISTFTLQDLGNNIHNSCYNLSKRKCLEYDNCGLCNDKCVPGDFTGPFYTRTCDNKSILKNQANKTNDMWTYRDNDKIVKSRPWGYLYDEYDYLGPVGYFV
jgi:hypothetical protein